MFNMDNKEVHVPYIAFDSILHFLKFTEQSFVQKDLMYVLCSSIPG